MIFLHGADGIGLVWADMDTYKSADSFVGYAAKKNKVLLMPTLQQCDDQQYWDNDGYTSGDDYPTNLNLQDIAIMNMVSRLEE